MYGGKNTLIRASVRPQGVHAARMLSCRKTRFSTVSGQQADARCPWGKSVLAVLFHLEDFEDVAFLDVGELLEGDAALVVLGDLLDVVFKPPERVDLVLGDDDAVPDDPDLPVTGDFAREDIAAGDGADARDLVDLADFGAAQFDLADLRGEHTLHRVLDVVDRVIDNAVHPHFDLVF